MPLPAALTKIRIGGDLRTFAAGRTANGRARFYVDTPVYAAGENVILTPEQPVTAAIADGVFLTDEFVSPTAAGVSPQGVPLRVEIRSSTYNDEWYVEIPDGASGTINLADLPRASTAPQVYTYALLTQLGDYIAKALVDAKGDLIVATGDGTVTRLAAGSNGHVLVVDSSTATGLKWQAGGGGGVTVHGDLIELNDDDHPQYYNQARGDARYARLAQLAAVALSGSYADLSGTVPTSALPAIAVTEYLGAAANQAAMLALAGQKGDWCTRTDLGTTWIITGDDPTQLASWTALTYPAAPVTSVNGAVGVVVLAKGDIGLGNVDNTSDTTKPVSTAMQTALNGKVNLSLVDAAGDLLVGSGADTLTRLAKGSDNQVLTVVSGSVAWATPAGGGAGLQVDPTAERYGCIALTMHPHDISWKSQQYLPLTSGRHYMYWVPLPVGTLVSGIRLPIQLAGSGAGELHFGVYQDDNTQLGVTGNVAAQFTGAVGETWQNVALTASAATTGDGVWITALSTLDTGPKVVFTNTDGVDPLPEWLLNPSSHRTALYRNGVASLPATLVPGTATPYIDFAIGVT